MVDEAHGTNGYGRELATLNARVAGQEHEAERQRSAVDALWTRTNERDRPQWGTWAAVLGVALAIGAAWTSPYTVRMQAMESRIHEDEGTTTAAAIDGAYQRGRADERDLSFQHQLDAADSESAARDHAQQLSIDALDIRLQREMDLKNQIQDANAAVEKKP